MLLSMPIRPSRVYYQGLLAIYGCALLVIVLLPMSMFGKAAALVAYGGCAWAAARNWRALAKVSHLMLEQGRLRLLVDNQSCAVETGRSILVHPWLVVLPVRNAYFRRTLLLFPDTAHADDLRRLRVWLKGRISLK